MNAPRSSPRKPLEHLRVMLTRAAGDNDEERAILQRFGAAVLELPAIDRSPPPDWDRVDLALRRLERYGLVVFTSRWTVRALFGRLAELGLQSALPAGMRVAAVGPATVAELRTRGVEATCVSTDGTASGLAETLVADGISDCTILVPGSDIARPELAKRLTAGGAHVEQIVVYRTVPAEPNLFSLEALAGGVVDVVAFASPSAVTSVLGMLKGRTEPLRSTRLVSIGPTTSGALRSAGLEPAITATTRSGVGLAEAVLRLYTGETSDE